jgi:hypothetical protein
VGDFPLDRSYWVVGEGQKLKDRKVMAATLGLWELFQLVFVYHFYTNVYKINICVLSRLGDHM